MSLDHRSAPAFSVRLLALALGVVAVVLAPHAAVAQQAPPPAAGTAPAFSQQDLDQLLAPIALYPDALLAQILMAATYPLEVVEAGRWAKSNPSVKGDALTNALQQQNWDPSVKSLVAVPNVLQMMSDKLDWTQKLGDAFLGQQQQVMSTVQNLRAKAQAAGNLKDSKEQKVIVEPAQGGSQTTVIKIEQADPQVVYVPAYNPTVVYGSWWWPAAPPYAWYPPGYVAGTALLSFTAGVIVGNALWGNCNWGHGDVDINVNRYNNFNRTNISNANWQHNVDHRRGVAYRDNATGARYGRNPARDQQNREAFRGRANENRGDLFSGRQDGGRAGGAGDRAGGRMDDHSRGQGIGDRDRGGDRPGMGGMGGMSGDRMGDRGGGRQDGGGSRGGDRQGQGAGGRGDDRAFGGAGQGADTRRFSDRGSESRAGMRGGDRGGNFGGGGGGGGRFGGGHGGRR